jgi:UDP-GlcNAc:undecaprenyl-phosphate GlcNAc-1-phosphate transferase
MFFVGLFDDLYTLSPQWKLSFQLLIATVAISSGIMFTFADSFWLNMILSVLWIVGLNNAVNLLDNMDGASSGIIFISMASLAFLPHHVEPALAQSCLLLAASVLGFLIFNFYPARVFMGDSGSLFLGNMAAMLLLLFSQTISPTVSHTFFNLPSAFLIPALMLFTPILDTTYVFLNRILNGYPVTQGDKGHVTHRLSHIMGGDRQAVLFIYAYQLGIALIVASYFWKLLYPVVAITLLLLYLITCLTNHKVWPEKFTELQWPKLLPHKLTEKLLDFKGVNQDLLLEKEASLVASGITDK